MTDATIETLLAVLGYGGIFLLMISNGAASFPSSQILYIITGYFVARGDLSFLPAVIVGALGNTVGTVILYELVRKHGRPLLAKLSWFPMRELAKVEAAFRKQGAWFVFVGKLLPAIKVYVPIPAALGKMPRPLFATLMALSSAIWAAGFIAIGYFFGKSSDLFGHYALILALVSAVVLYSFYRYMNSEAVIREVERS